MVSDMPFSGRGKKASNPRKVFDCPTDDFAIFSSSPKSVINSVMYLSDSPSSSERAKNPKSSKYPTVGMSRSLQISEAIILDRQL